MKKILEKFNVEEHASKIEFIRKYQRYAYGVLVFIIVLNTFFWIVSPNYSAYKKTQSNLERYTELLEQRRAKTEEKKNMLRELARLEGSISEMQYYFFTKEEFNEFSINILPKIASNLQNNVKAITFNPPTHLKEGISTAHLGIRLEGSFASIINFFDELENYSKIVTIEEFGIKRIGKNPVRLSVSIEATAFVLSKQENGDS